MTAAIPAAAVRAELDRIVASAAFSGANRSIRLLRYVVDEALEGRGRYLKEYTLGTEALERGPSFDPRVDPIARVEASRLRSRLDHYYATDGRRDELVIALPRGGYVPQFELRAVEPFGADARAGRGRLVVAAALAAVALAAFALGRFWPTPQATPREIGLQSLQLSVALGADGVLGSEVGNDLALSPDGSTLAFVALLPDGSTRLYARRLDGLRAHELPGTVGARGPFFSPDGLWVGFWSQGKLRKTLVEGGGSPVVLAETTDLLGASWSEDGGIVAALDQTPTLWRVDAAGGTRVPLVDVAATGAAARWPQVLPGGRAVLFTSMRGGADRSIAVVSLADRTVKTLVRGGTYGLYLANGDLLYVDRGTLFAVPFDAERLEIRGAPVPVVDSVTYSPAFGFAAVAVANNGTLVYRRSAASGLVTLAWLEEGGGATPLLAEPGRYQWPRLSPDGKRLAYSLLENSDHDIWLYDLESRVKTRLTHEEGNAGTPLWTSDGAAVLYTVDGGAIFWRRSDGSGSAEQLLPGVRIPWSSSSDGVRLAYHKMDVGSGFDLWTVPLAFGPTGLTTGAEERFYGSSVFETYPTFSPDGRWMAYGSNESGVWEVYVRAFPDNGRAQRVSNRGGRVPAWSRSRSELLYETNDHRLMAVRYRVADDEIILEAPRAWSATALADTGVLANFDVAPDGRVIAMLASDATAPQADTATVTVIANAFAELARARARVER